LREREHGGERSKSKSLVFTKFKGAWNKRRLGSHKGILSDWSSYKII